MKRKVLRAVAAVLLFVIVPFVFTGCAVSDPESLFVLPRLPEEYLNLQEMLDAVLNSGAEYSPPAGGSNRQSVQLKDLDGDGVNECLAFLEVTRQESPLQISIFERRENRYVQAAIISGSGERIASVEYLDLDGNGSTELVVEWRAYDGSRTLSAYSVAEGQAQQLFTAQCQACITGDLNGDGMPDVAAVHVSASELGGTVKVFSMTADGQVLSREASLSNGVETMAQLSLGVLSTGETALFVDSVINGSSLVTDVILLQAELAVNLTTGENGVSSETMRLGGVSCRDIDGDGVTDIPTPKDASGYMLEWHTVSGEGVRELSCITCYNSSDGWYMIVPEYWSSVMSVRRGSPVSGEKSIVFYIESVSGEAVDILAVYTLTGSQRQERAHIDGRFFLAEYGDTVWAAKITEDAEDYVIRIDRETIESDFYIIYTDWI